MGHVPTDVAPDVRSRSYTIEAQVPVLPVLIEGTRECRPKGSLWFGRARATARILSPVPTRGMGMGDVARLRDAVRGRIEASHAA